MTPYDFEKENGYFHAMVEDYNRKTPMPPIEQHEQADTRKKRPRQTDDQSDDNNTTQSTKKIQTEKRIMEEVLCYRVG